MNYFLLFVLCFVPVLSFKWASRISLKAPPPLSFAREKAKPPSLTMLHRVTSSGRRPALPPTFSPSRYSSPASEPIPKPPSHFSTWFSSPKKNRKPTAMAANAQPPPPPASSIIRTPLNPSAATRKAEDIVTLTAFLGSRDSNADIDLVVLMTHVQAACKHIAAILASPTELKARLSGPEADVGAGRDTPKPLDIVSNNILKAALRNSGKVAAIASEEDDVALWFGEGPYVVVFDPLDGSRNIDAGIPTGTIFGIYRRLPEADHLPLEEKAAVNVLQKGEQLVAAGYALYSSATMMCISVGSGLHCFTLDYTIGEFVLSHPDIRVPERGQIYSVNDARYFDWPAGLRRYIDTIRQGKGQNPKKYSARYICSLVADLHRTMLYGGLAMNPRSHLRLVYEANPLSFLVEQGGGKGTDGKQRIMEIQPAQLHQRLPLFLGSRADIAELLTYKDVQQLVNPGYEV